MMFVLEFLLGFFLSLVLQWMFLSWFVGEHPLIVLKAIIRSLGGKDE